MSAAMRLVLGISGGIAAYKMPHLIRLLRRRSVEVKVVLTAAAEPLVGVEALRVVSENPLYADSLAAVHDMDHIRLAQWADYLFICPATANTIAKIAHGIADNLLTTLSLCFERRLCIAPAMNTAMWENQATRNNVELLRSRGVDICPVDSGDLACGTSGAGRLPELEFLADHVCSLGVSRILAGKEVLIASGPTLEPLDPVRVITNRSSGRMGNALARAARDMGATVTMINGPAPLAPPPGVSVVPVTTAVRMHDELHSRFDSSHICIMAAAVSDYRPRHYSPSKIHRSEGLTLELVPNNDIAASLGARKAGQILVCFALEHEQGLERAQRKLEDKNADLVVLNYVSSSLEQETAGVTLIGRSAEPEELPVGSKDAVARSILERAAELLGVRNG